MRVLVLTVFARAPAASVSAESTSPQASVSRIISTLSTAAMSVSAKDCPSVPISLLTASAAMVLTDNKVALRQLELANAALLSGTSVHSYTGKSIAKDGKFHPRVLTLVRAVFALLCGCRSRRQQGGDHTITLPLLRGVASVYGPVSVIHFDSHLDTWKPKPMADSPWLPGEEIPVSHGSYFYYAHKEGLLAPNNANIVCLECFFPTIRCYLHLSTCSTSASVGRSIAGRTTKTTTSSAGLSRTRGMPKTSAGKAL